MKQVDALSPLLFNFALEYVIHVIQDGLKLNGTHHLLVYADDDNMFGGSVHTVKENAEALVVASMEIGLEVNGTPKKKLKKYRKVSKMYMEVCRLESIYKTSLGNCQKEEV